MIIEHRYGGSIKIGTSAKCFPIIFDDDSYRSGADHRYEESDYCCQLRISPAENRKDESDNCRINRGNQYGAEQEK